MASLIAFGRPEAVLVPGRRLWPVLSRARRHAYASALWGPFQLMSFSPAGLRRLLATLLTLEGRRHLASAPRA